MDKYQNVIKYIKATLNQCRPFLIHEKTIVYVEHYLKYGEYEMAFEILFLGIMDSGKVPMIDVNKGMEVAKLLRLDKETIYDVNFWTNFKVFMQL
ncbi:hypothetical protein [Chitinophaga deserti]|uniref:hypothetical protein n=1 Tax=Chitinophaga deserti TaxID=2164099 RepID=UPI000D6A8FD4|nr:hypothetical protein [Chitinophaga deserti]